jgi:hypothetical protein
MPSKLEAKPSQAKVSQTEPHILTLQFSPVEFKKLTAAAKYSNQTLAEWIASMCHLATVD